MDYNTGYQYSATGSGITANGNLSPGTGTNNVTIDGVTSTWTGINSKLIVHTNNTRSSVPVYRNVFRSWFKQPYNYSENHRRYKHNGHYKYFLAVILSGLFPTQALAEVGGVSATAASGKQFETSDQPGNSGFTRSIYH